MVRLIYEKSFASTRSSGVQTTRRKKPTVDRVGETTLFRPTISLPQFAISVLYQTVLATGVICGCQVHVTFVISKYHPVVPSRILFKIEKRKIRFHTSVNRLRNFCISISAKVCRNFERIVEMPDSRPWVVCSAVNRRTVNGARVNESGRLDLPESFIAVHFRRKFVSDYGTSCGVRIVEEISIGVGQRHRSSVISSVPSKLTNSTTVSGKYLYDGWKATQGPEMLETEVKQPVQHVVKCPTKRFGDGPSPSEQVCTNKIWTSYATCWIPFSNKSARGFLIDGV